MDERLDEYDKEEWREVVRYLLPDWTDEQFEKVWYEFLELKKSKSIQ